MSQPLSVHSKSNGKSLYKDVPRRSSLPLHTKTLLLSLDAAQRILCASAGFLSCSLVAAPLVILLCLAPRCKARDWIVCEFTQVSWDFMDQIEIFEEHDFSRMFLQWICRSAAAPSFLQRCVLGAGLCPTFASRLPVAEEHDEHLLSSCNEQQEQSLRVASIEKDANLLIVEEGEEEEEEEQQHKRGEIAPALHSNFTMDCSRDRISSREPRRTPTVVHDIGDSREGRSTSCSRAERRAPRPHSLVKNDSGFALEVDSPCAKAVS
ncbi:hypothetical protein IE81DRAFT_343452 [Ceraceosorus guamensis]|uniref:Uncharacterized protein n=1 Tax=Ceraceosorus guamensis TaxID=1522189 RepID=A0A316VNR6_9BASI|nr:hypothetical protein IE81DRAFT_343452 [Ceraceosorus guamensis]PWN39279.1 hypothetical protein IE81DRAFT_343452 [Ceraceosorus guamensis]